MSVEIITNGNWNTAFDSGLEAGTIELCVRVCDQAKEFAPVDKGRLRQSYQWKTEKAVGGKEGSEKDINVNPRGIGEGYVGSSVVYSIYQEFGTRYMAPQPHFRPAVDRIVKGTEIKTVLAKIQREKAKGPLKEGQKRVRF